MTDDEILAILHDHTHPYYSDVDHIAFARRMFALGAAAEREACAGVCETLAHYDIERIAQSEFSWAASTCAAAIRARSET